MTLTDEQVAEALKGTRFHKGFVGLSDQSIGEWYWSFGFAEAIDALRLLAEAKVILDQIYMITHVGDQDIPYPLLKDMFRWCQHLQGDDE